MKNVSPSLLVCIALLVACTATTGFAQDDKRQARAFLTIGPVFEGGASMILAPPDGFKVKPIFAYRAGVAATYPLNPAISASLGFGVDSRGTQVHFENNSDFYTNTNLSYFSIMPGFNFSGFVIGFNFGLPLSVGVESDPDNPFNDIQEKAIEDKQTVLLEPRIGGIIPLLDDKTGTLLLSITGGVSLNEFYDREGLEDEDGFGTLNIASLHVGISYQFAIPGTKQK